MSSVIIVQGEGKGHFSQAIAFIRAAEKENEAISRIFLGRSFFRKTPDYFLEELHELGYPVHRFFSPNFIRTPDRKGIQIVFSLLINLLIGPLYFAEAFRIRTLAGRDLVTKVINFYDPLGALAFRWLSTKIERIQISHHFYLSHPDFIHPHGLESAFFWMAYMNRFMIRSADRIIALSFRKGDTNGKIEVFPPLIDSRVLNINVSQGRDDLCYLLSPGFIKDLSAYYEKNPERSVKLFSADLAPEALPVNIELLPPSRLGLLSTFQLSSRVICTAGFDLVAEAFYLGLPVFLIPSEKHYEQYCNALDAARTGMAFQLEAISDLSDAELDTKSNLRYREWVESLRIADILSKSNCTN